MPPLLKSSGSVTDLEAPLFLEKKKLQHSLFIIVFNLIEAYKSLRSNFLVELSILSSKYGHENKFRMMKHFGAKTILLLNHHSCCIYVSVI
jgi:hypothetical protein